MKEENERNCILSLILADSELERVPEKFWSHPSVVSNAKRRRKKSSSVLLDTSLHHSLFQDPVERNRRGRPDIVHQFLMIGLESLLSLEGGVRLYIHTRNDEMITISPETRIPKNQNRFFGLFEELFRSGKVPSEVPLIELRKETDLKSTLHEVRSSEADAMTIVWLMDPDGEMTDPYQEMEGLISKTEDPIHLICILGGFSSGAYRSPMPPVNRRISIHHEQLKSWAVEMELITAFRRVCFRGSRISEEA